MADQEEQRALIGDPSGSFWLYSSHTGFDLTHPATPSTPLTPQAITLQTTTSQIHVDPSKSALVIIDMQNFFLSSALGRPGGSKGLRAEKQLLDHAIPAARKAGMQVAWLNWGLSDEDLKVLPPATLRAFGFNTLPASEFEALLENGKDTNIYKGLGKPLGTVTLPDGTETDAGRMLMREQWNTLLHDPLQREYENSRESRKPDVWLHKARISGMHLPDTPAGRYLEESGIRTLFFAGVNTDQCVNGTLTDAYCYGYDCILLRDGCATTSPAGAQECVENNASRTFGFLIDCEAFAQGVEQSLGKRS